MALLKINGVDLPTPSSLTPGIQDIGKWERNARGTMIGELIAKKVKLDCTWSVLSGPEMAALLAKINPLFFNVTYLDPETNTFRTATFYKGDRNIPMLDYINGVPRYNGFKVNFIER